MSEFVLSDEIDNEKCFILNRTEIEKRLDPFYYIPSIKKLEEVVKNKGAMPLRTYVENISSGATPKTSEKEKYYSDKENGIPFLRVQNLSYTGFLKLDNCKYINEETHNNYLKRSQVSGADLLVKITGVGRMAVASVAPDGFVGNTNQHMVVIKTKDRQTSEMLASYLNTDIGEMLASRRATGGTRPALDYPALLSIPIIFDNKILEIYKSAIESKKQKEKQAKELLESIDTYLLEELGITLPQIENGLEKRIFEVNLSDISGNRFDSNSYHIIKRNAQYQLEKSLYKLKKLKATTPFYKEIVTENKDNLPYIGLENIESNTGVYIEKRNREKFSSAIKFKKGQILFPKLRPYLNKVHLARFDGLCSTEFHIFDSDKVANHYLSIFLSSQIVVNQTKYLMSGNTLPRLQTEDIEKLLIPIPPITKQNEIAEYIQTIRDNAKQLNYEAKQDLENAKIEVEKMILGQ